jgi:hypothetical protein
MRNILLWVLSLSQFVTNVFGSSCDYDCYDHGSCTWTHNPERHGLPSNSSNFICDCDDGYYGRYCNNTNTITPEEKKEMEEKVEEEVKRYMGQELVAVFCGIGGGIVLLILGLYVWQKRRKQKKLEEIMKINTVNINPEEDEEIAVEKRYNKL